MSMNLSFNRLEAGNDPANLVEAAGGKGSGLSCKETLYPDRRWC